MPPYHSKPRSSHLNKGSAKRSQGQQKEWLYGFHSVIAALEAGKRRFYQLILDNGTLSEKQEQCEWLAEKNRVDISYCDKKTLEQISSTTRHQGVALQCTALPVFQEAALKLAIRNSKTDNSRESKGAVPIWAALDQIQDPQNIGAIARSAEAFGIKGIISLTHNAAPISPFASAASAGSLERVSIYQVSNLARVVQFCQQQWFDCVATTITGGQPLNTYEASQHGLLVVLGGEGKGVRPLTKKLCQQQITIPMCGEGHLNVASTAAILFHQFRFSTAF